MLGCGVAPCPKPEAPPPRPAPAASAQTEAPEPAEPHPEPPALTVAVVPVLEMPLSVRVNVTSRLPGATTWHFPAKSTQVRDLRVSVGDAQTVAPQVSGSASDQRFELPASAQPVQVSYRVELPPPLLDPTRMVLPGERVLLLPDVAEPVRVQVHIDVTPYGKFAQAVSCLGPGNTRELELTSTALKRCELVAGMVGHARFDGPEGFDEAAWLGYTAFDPRSSAAEIAAFRTAARTYFGSSAVRPLTLMLLADDRPDGAFTVSRRTASVVAHVGLRQTWDGPLRLSVAHQVLREWMGGELWIGPRQGSEAIWFNEGVTRYLARKLLWKFGLLEPDELRDEVEALMRVQLTSPGRDDPSDSHRPTWLVARGALYANLVDGRISQKSAGKASLDKVLRELFKRAREKGDDLPEAAWVSALAAELGPEASRLHERLRASEPIELPRGALGKCFTPVPRRYAQFELGYETEREGKYSVARVTNGSAAARAGLRTGDRILKASYVDQRPDVPAKLRIDRAGSESSLEYLPAGKRLPGTGWRVKPHATSEKCQ